jgi:hypothetical protein
MTSRHNADGFSAPLKQTKPSPTGDASQLNASNFVRQLTGKVLTLAAACTSWRFWSSDGTFWRFPRPIFMWAIHINQVDETLVLIATKQNYVKRQDSIASLLALIVLFDQVRLPSIAWAHAHHTTLRRDHSAG